MKSEQRSTPAPIQDPKTTRKGAFPSLQIRQSFLEKVWVTLMVAALTVAAVTATAGDRWVDSTPTQANSLKRVITEVFVR